jgi:hypothetical protein
LRKRGWGDDHLASLIVRAASGPAMTTQANWARELTQVALAFFAILTPMSAAARLLAAGLNLQFDGVGSILVPNITGQQAAWTQEGQPIRVVQDLTSGPTLEPRKLASVVVLTREMIQNQNSETFIREALIASCAGALDSTLFGSAAADASRPAGLLFGATNVTASTSTDLFTSMGSDIGNLVGAIASYSGNGSLALIGHPAQMTRLAMYAPQLPYLQLQSAALAPGVVIAAALNAIASAIEPVAVDAMTMPSVHFEDANPLPLGSASPAENLWQSDCVGLRVKLPASWVTRSAAAVAFTTAVKW